MQTMQTVRGMREMMDESLGRLLSAVEQLSEEQLGPKDAAGWNVCDHLTHLAVWADGVAALLRREECSTTMGVTLTDPDSDELDYDARNEQVVEHQ